MPTMQEVLFKRKTTEEIEQLEIEDGSLIYNVDNGKTYMDYGTERIPTGGGANGGIYVGDTEPTDPDITLWVDTPTSETKASEIVTEYTESDKVGYCTNYINELNTYSTDEIRVGTWIDGKPIYRKILEYSVNSTGISSFTHNLNIDRLVKLDGLCTVAGQSVSSNGYRNIPYQVSNSEYFMVESVRTNSILFYVGTWTNNKAYVILEYTKTTD